MAPVAAGALVAAPCPFVINWILGLRLGGYSEARIALLSEAVNRSGNDILRMLHWASTQSQTVLITLDNRKAYIGMVIRGPSLEAHDCFASLVPLFSGFRDKDTLDLTLTVKYTNYYKDGTLDPSDFAVVLPISSIRAISFFDEQIYHEVFSPTAATANAKSG